MKIWNYIGEFFLFRWLFGKLKSTDNNQRRMSELPNNLNKSDCDGYRDDLVENNLSGASGTYGANRSNSTDYQDYSDDAEDLDDLDTFMRENSARDYSNHYRLDSDRFSTRDYDSNYDYSDSQSFDNFHEEQDDYDIMDDF